MIGLRSTYTIEIEVGGVRDSNGAPFSGLAQNAYEFTASDDPVCAEGWVQG